jgi:hypothetical protein
MWGRGSRNGGRFVMGVPDDAQIHTEDTEDDSIQSTRFWTGRSWYFRGGETLTTALLLMIWSGLVSGHMSTTPLVLVIMSIFAFLAWDAEIRCLNVFE